MQNEPETYGAETPTISEQSVKTLANLFWKIPMLDIVIL